MKYIRTKDGIFDLSRFKFEKGDIDQSKVGSRQDCYLEQHDIEYCLHRCIWVKDIIKQADTLEELIDEYIVDETAYKTFGKKKPYLSEHSFYQWVDEIDFAYECGVNLYLGIWVDGELRKVAKVNKKGELELL